MLSRLEHLDISSVTDKTLHRLKRGTEQKAHSCSLVHVFTCFTCYTCSLVYNINVRSFFTFQSFFFSLGSLLFIFTCFSFIFHLGNLYFYKLFVFPPFVHCFFSPLVSDSQSSNTLARPSRPATSTPFPPPKPPPSRPCAIL